MKLIWKRSSMPSTKNTTTASTILHCRKRVTFKPYCIFPTSSHLFVSNNKVSGNFKLSSFQIHQSSLFSKPTHGFQLIFKKKSSILPDNTANRNPYAAFKIPEFKNFIAGRCIYIMGLRMTSTVIGWWIYLLTNSKLALGFVGLSEVIPALSLALYAGHYIDINEKRRLLLRCILGYAACILIPLLLSTGFIGTHVHHWTIAVLICTVIGITGQSGLFRAYLFCHDIPDSSEEYLIQRSIHQLCHMAHCFHLRACHRRFPDSLAGHQQNFYVILIMIAGGYFSRQSLPSSLYWSVFFFF